MAESSGPVIDRLIDFQQYRFGLPPAEFDYDATGPHGPVLSAGRPLWRAYVDLFAPSPKLVLIQSSALADADHYPIALLRDVYAVDLKLAVSFKMPGGNLARSAGLLWQAQDNGSYDALLVDGSKHEARLLRVRGGRPVELLKAKAAFDESEWNSLEVSSQNGRTAAWLNDRLVLETRGEGAATPGRVGLITHADTIAVFDDFYIQSGEGRVVRKARPIPKQSAAPIMRIADIVMTDAEFRTLRASFKPGGRIYWMVRVSDQNQKPVSAAFVECEIARLDGDVPGVEKAMTGTDGTALFSRLLPADAASGVHTIRVKAVVHSDLSEAMYTPHANLKSVASFEVR